MASACEGLAKEPFGVFFKRYRSIDRRIGLRDKLFERFKDRVLGGDEKIRHTVPSYCVVGHRSMQHTFERPIAHNLPPSTKHTLSAHIQLDFKVLG